MDTKALLDKIIDNLKKELTGEGIAVCKVIDGCLSSSAEFAVNEKDRPKVFRLLITEIDKILE